MRALALGTVVLLVACPPSTLRARMRDGERRAEQAQAALDEAQKAAQALEPDAMDRALKDAKEALMSPNIDLYPEASMHVARYKEIAAQAPQVRGEREKRDLELRLNMARDKLMPLVRRLTEAMEKLEPTSPTKQTINALDDAADDLKDELNDEKELFEKDKDFATWAKSHQAKAEKALELVARAKKGLAFISGPGEALTQALKLQKDASAANVPEKKTQLLEDAREKLLSCEKNAAVTDASIAGTPLLVAGKPQTPAQVLALCRATLKSVLAATPKKPAVKPPAAKPAPKKK